MQIDWYMSYCILLVYRFYKITCISMLLEKHGKPNGKTLVCSWDEVWGVSRRPAPQVAQPKHLLCEFPVGCMRSAYLAGPCWKNHTQCDNIITCSFTCTSILRLLLSCVGVRSEAQIVAPTGNTQLSLASCKQIFRSLSWVSDVPLICIYFFPTRLS